MSEPIVRGNKRINDRRHPGIKGRRPDYAAYRKREAEARNKAYAALSLEEKKRRNPKKFLNKA